MASSKQEFPGSVENARKHQATPQLIKERKMLPGSWAVQMKKMAHSKVTKGQGTQLF